MKQYNTRDNSRNIDSEWLHDKHEAVDQRPARGGRYDDRQPYGREPEERPRESHARLRVENIHYELSENDLKELFARIGPVESIRMLYDKLDRPQGTAFVTYASMADARDAVREFDGANAYGQPITVGLAPPTAPAPGRGSRNPFDNVEKPSRSLFDRIESSDPAPRGGRRGRDRNYSPGRLAPPPSDRVDRYVPGGRGGRDRDSRSPIPRRGTPRIEGGRRPGARREDSGRQGGRGGRGGGRDGAGGRGENAPGQGRSGARPRKTAEELDAEMNDYWGDKGGPSDSNAAAQSSSLTGEARGPQGGTISNGENAMTGATSTINAGDDLDLMIE